MNQPAGIYSTIKIVFDTNISYVQNIILSQAATALNAVINRISELEVMIESSPIAEVSINPHIPTTITEICNQAGIAATILFNDQDIGHRESKLSYQLRNERVEYVKKCCSDARLHVTTIKERKIRNSLTHIDEHLADALTENPNVGWFIDCAIDSRDTFILEKPNADYKFAYCRVYIRSENVVLHLDNEISIKDLKKDCINLLAVVFGRNPYQIV